MYGCIFCCAVEFMRTDYDVEREDIVDTIKVLRESQMFGFHGIDLEQLLCNGTAFEVALRFFHRATTTNYPLPRTFCDVRMHKAELCVAIIHPDDSRPEDESRQMYIQALLSGLIVLFANPYAKETNKQWLKLQKRQWKLLESMQSNVRSFVESLYLSDMLPAHHYEHKEN